MSDTIEWHPDPTLRHAYTAMTHRGEVTVSQRKSDGSWEWTDGATKDWQGQGEAWTCDEAKAAALIGKTE